MSEPPAEVGQGAPAVPLDQVMLAMDVVDTLRHERALVDAALNTEQRAQELAARVRAIYAAQGIEVPDDVIAAGVQALEQDRFVYRPPERTLAVRLAEVYVERGKWGRRAAAVAGIALVVAAGISASSRLARARATRAFEQRVAAVAKLERAVAADGEALAGALARAGDAAGRSAPLAGILAAVEPELRDARAHLAGLQPPPPAVEAWAEDQERAEAALEERRQGLTDVAARLGHLRGQLAAVARLSSLGGESERLLARLRGIALSPAIDAELARLRGAVDEALLAGDETRARQALDRLEQRVAALVQGHEAAGRARAELAQAQARLAGVAVEAPAQEELSGLRAGVEAALAAGDTGAAERQAVQLRALVDELDLAYELRIVSAPGVQSGVWREPAGQRDVRNYYLIVEALDARGAAIELAVTSEEDRRTRRVKRFGVRVAETVFEAVKADKQDNGIVEQSLVAVKQRGQRGPAYRIAVLGGRITEW